MSTANDDIETLLAAAPSAEAGRALLGWVKNLYGRIDRGDMMVGILSAAEVGRAPQALERAIDCGVAEARMALADWQASPPFGEPAPEAAVATLRAAIAAGVAGARLRLAQVQWFHRRDEASPAEQAEACEMLKAITAAAPDDAQALYHLGLLTCRGFGVAADPALAAGMQAQAAALGHAPAMLEAFIHHETGLGVPQDSARAFGYLEQAAEAGDPRALYNMGAYCATGRMVRQDMAEAAKWYRKAADAGHIKALATLAVMYATGDGVAQDAEHAAELFDEAEYLGLDVEAMRESVGL